MIRFTTENGLRQEPKDYDFSVLPNMIFSRPPYDVIEIDRSKSFAIALEWGHWAVILWFVKLNEAEK